MMLSRAIVHIRNICPLGASVNRGFPRNKSSLSVERRKKLVEIYKPFAKLEKNGPEYNALALTGKVWEDYHQPSESKKKGYMRLERVRFMT